jgi:ribosomal protein S18 acetylase RimI-like enzyme
MSYSTVELSADTWGLFAELVERNNGVYGGCWCIGYHLSVKQPGLDHRAAKHDLVHSGRAHAALVLDDEQVAQGWCQYGSPEELPGIKHLRAYRNDPPPSPDWRLTCVYVDRRHRGQGVARAAVAGALQQIGRRGGGRVEVISETTEGRTAPGHFLFSATAELFADYGFARVRQVGKHAWIMSRTVEPH